MFVLKTLPTYLSNRFAWNLFCVFIITFLIICNIYRNYHFYIMFDFILLTGLIH